MLDKIKPVSIRLDPRFNMDENWKVVSEAVQRCKARGLLVTPRTVFKDNKIIGWYLEGWEPPKPLYTYTPPNNEEPFFSDWTI